MKLSPSENQTEIALRQAAREQLHRRDGDHRRMLAPLSMEVCGTPCSLKYIVIKIPKKRLIVGTPCIVPIAPVDVDTEQRHA